MLDVCLGTRICVCVCGGLGELRYLRLQEENKYKHNPEGRFPDGDRLPRQGRSLTGYHRAWSQTLSCTDPSNIRAIWMLYASPTGWYTVIYSLHMN